MDFAQLAKARYSARKYTPAPVEAEKLERVLQAVNLAPSAHNSQPVSLVVLTGGELKEKVAGLYERDWIKEVPVILVVVADHDQSWKREDGKDHADIDAGIAIDHLMLAAAAEGLGSCCVCSFSAARCAALLELPPNCEVVALLPLGHPAVEGDPDRHAAKRKKLEEVVRRGSFGRG